MSKPKPPANEPKPLSDKELDKTSGGASSVERENLEKRVLAADELAKISGGTTSDPRRGIPGEIFGPKKR